MVVLTGVLVLATVAIGALTIDFSRLANLKAELQTSADAGAHAGMQRWLQPGATATQATDTASAYALANLAMQGTVTLEAVEIGHWDGASFTPAGTPFDAVRVVVSRQSAGLVMTVLGVPSPRVFATAIATSATFPLPPTQRPILVR
jgi:hypothetical protein